MVQESIEHGRREGGIAAEGVGPLGEGQVGGQDQGTLLVALGDDLEEQIGLLAGERQIADLVDDQEPRGEDVALEIGLNSTLSD